MLESIAGGGIGVGFLLIIMFGIFAVMFSVAALGLAVIRFVFVIPMKLLGFIFGSHQPYVEKRPRVKSRQPERTTYQRAFVRGGRKVCANQRCGYANRPSAVYCGRCGQRL